MVRPAFRIFLVVLIMVLTACSGGGITLHKAAEGGVVAARVLFLAGPDSHGPWAHEHQAGSELLAEALHEKRPDFEISVYAGGWPDDERVFSGIDALIIYADGGEGHMVNAHVEAFNRLIAEGVGVAALHYAVEVPKASPSAQAMLAAIGGYFETDWSVNPYWVAQYKTLPPHPIASGVQPFSMDDEWYFNMRFVPGEVGITPLLTAVPPVQTMERDNGPYSGNEAVRKMVDQGAGQTTAWAFERAGAGRGFGFTGGHYHANWQDANALNLVVNAVEWIAQGRVNGDG
jgi:type 1 glutamine amidotransferase